jgi:hypothetical protein
MPEIKFSTEKADRWIARIAKRTGKLTPDDLSMFETIKQIRANGDKISGPLARALFDLERKV